MTLPSIRRSRYSKLVSLCLTIAFIMTMVITPRASYAQGGVLGLPAPGAMVNLSSSYVPLMITGLTVHPENPLLMDFIVSTGNSGLNAAQVKEQSNRLIKYFLACLTIPENDQWVNLSPYEKQRIVPEDLGQTVLGQDMLAQDYLLKQLTASLIYPEKNLGKSFWDKVYAKARVLYGTTQIPVNTFNKVWILPDTAKVFEHKDTVFVVKSHLKVMLDEDYLALSHHVIPANPHRNLGAGAGIQNTNVLGNQIVRQIILPAIEEEVNTGKNFANMRQIYNSMILAVWFKKNLKQALLNQVYADKAKVSGVNVNDPAIKEKIYKQYLEAYKKGVFNYIKEEVDQNTQQVMPRKYFSGGLTPVTRVDQATADEAMAAFNSLPGENENFTVKGLTQNAPVKVDAVMTGKPGQALESILSGKLLSAKKMVQLLLDAYYAAKAAGQADEAKRLDGEINKIVDQLNVYGQSKPEELVLSDDVESLSSFLSSPEVGTYRRLARRYFLAGNYVPQFIFAGAATRLNDALPPNLREPMYNQDIWGIADALGKGKFGDGKFHLGMGPRQIMAYRLAIEGLARQEGVSAEEAIANQKIIINVNADIEQMVLDDFLKNNFYGFKPENVYFIVQPTFHGYKFENGSLEFDPQSPTVPYGHGYNFMQLGEKGQAFTLGADRSRHYLPDSILNQFSDSMLIGSHRINDLTKLSKDSVISIDKLAFAIAKLGQGFNVVGELVDNPNKQKGGNVLKDTKTGKSFLIETSNVKGSNELVNLLDEAGKIGAPYNAFRLVYGVGSLKKILKNSLPYNLRFKDGDFYLEAVTGDVTQMPETKAKFMSSGEEIHDFKEPKNIDDALNYLRQSDDQLTRAADSAMTAGVLPRVNPTKTSSWQRLKSLAGQRKKYNLRDLFSKDPQRAEKWRVELSPQFEVDFSRNLVDDETLKNLIGLAKEVGLQGAIEQMFKGDKVNETENRAVLHTALRNVKRDANGNLVALSPVYDVDGKDVMPGVIAVLKKMEAFTKKVQSGQWRGASGKKIKNIINVGIGGSDLGPQMAVQALEPYKAGDIDAYFVSNIDGTAAAKIMKKLDPEETLVIIASKTFTTQETMQNAQTLKNWVLNAYKGTEYEGSPEIIKKHFVAVSTAEKLVTDFGIDKDNMFEFWDWVGGRYSVWSAIGLSLATYVGFDNFLQFLEGGHEADEHFRTQPFERNISVLKALLNVWYGNFLGAKSEAILPYDQYLGLFPAFTQQFFMESEGKRADRNGDPINYPTGLVVFGSAGTDAQHSYLQMFHQHPETTLIPADFIGVLRSHNDLPGHHDRLFSNFVAQREALAFGLTKDEVEKALNGDPKFAALGPEYIKWLAQHKTFPGSRPTTSILVDQVTPRTLGNLIATYENQIYAESIIWNIFPNDQWGVELGKKVATGQVLPYLTGARNQSELSQSGLSAGAQRDIAKFLAANAANKAMTVETKPIDANARLAKFGTSGDRGIIEWPEEGRPNGDFNMGLVRRDTQGIAEYGLQTTPVEQRRVLIGYDTRHRNPEFSKEEARIMAANGFTVLYVRNKAVSTPVLASYAARRKSSMFGVINDTASHSQYTDGGIKFSPNHGGAADTKTTDTIQKLANEATTYKTVDYDKAVNLGRIRGSILELDADDLVKEYVDDYLIPTMKETKALDGRSMWEDIIGYFIAHPQFKLIVDPLQGTGVDVNVLLYQRFSEAAGRQVAEIIHTNNKDPKFSEIKKNAPQPMGEPVKDLMERVKTHPGSFGLAQDGDADRFGVIDFGGQEVPANDIVALLAWFLKRDVGLNGAVVKTVATSNFANAVAKYLGLKLIETPVGFKYTVDEVMKGEDVLVGGEESAHVGTKPFMQSWDDGFATGLMALWIVARTGKSLMDYKKAIEAEIGQSYHMKTATVRDEQGVAKKNVIALIDAAKEEMKSVPATEISLAKKAEDLTGQKVESINTMDGLKLVFESGDWILMRPSGTEPAAKLYVEVSSPDRQDELYAAAEKLMGKPDNAQMSGGVSEDDDMALFDAAMKGKIDHQNSVNPGGIDLNSGNLKMESSGEKVQMVLPSKEQGILIAQFKRGDFSGVRIKILDVVPVNLMPLLGLKEE